MILHLISCFHECTALFFGLFPQYNDIIRTSKFPFHNPLVMKYYNVLAYFSLDYDHCPFTFAQILYRSNTHKLHEP